MKSYRLGFIYFIFYKEEPEQQEPEQQESAVQESILMGRLVFCL